MSQIQRHEATESSRCQAYALQALQQQLWVNIHPRLHLSFRARHARQKHPLPFDCSSHYGMFCGIMLAIACSPANSQYCLINH